MLFVPSPDLPEFQKTQFAFSGRIRNPEVNSIPNGIEERRMKIYQDLFYNSVEDLLASNFPVARSITDEQRWHHWIREFFIHHRCDTPYFIELGQEFIAFVAEHQQRLEMPDFMQELLHYEWVELAVDIDDSEEPQPQQGLSVLEGKPLLCSALWSLTYQYPVHQIGPDFQPEQPSEQPICLLVYRDRNDAVQFMVLTPMSAHMIWLISENETQTGEQLLQTLIQSMPQYDAKLLYQGGVELYQQFQQAGVLLGALPICDQA